MCESISEYYCIKHIPPYLCLPDPYSSFRPSSGIKIEVFRKSMLSVMFPNKQHLIGRFSGKLVELLENGKRSLETLECTGSNI